MPATAELIIPDGLDIAYVKVTRDPNRDPEWDEQPVPPDVAQALVELAAPSLQSASEDGATK